MKTTNRFAAVDRPHGAPAPKAQQHETIRSSVFAPDDLIPVGDIDLAVPDVDRGVYRHGAAIFGAYAQQMYKLGWMPFPQTRLDGRKPPVIDGKMLSWREFQKQRAPLKLIKHWMLTARTCNVALILGEASQGVFAIDIDITDPILAQLAVDLVVELLGMPLSRRGNFPKVALLYRVEDLADLPHYGSFRLATDAGDASEHQIEILGNGHMITAVGLHHKTDQEFACSPASPVMWAPSDLTAVTKVQLEALWTRIETEFKLYRPRRGAGPDINIEEGSSEGINVPRLSAFNASQWVENDAGLVIDGREKFLYALVRETVRRNPPSDGTSTGDLRVAITEGFRAKEKTTDRWTESRLSEEIVEKLTRCLRDLAEGRLKPQIKRTILTDQGPVIRPAKPFRRPADREHGHDAFEFLGRNRASLPTRTQPIDPSAAVERKLRLDRPAVGSEAAAALETAILAFFSDVMSQTNRVHVLGGPTGLGKSTMALKLAASHDALFAAMTSPDGSAVGPIVFLVPQYRNVDELRTKASMLGLDPTATDAELLAAAAALGMVSEGDTAERLTQLRRFAADSKLRTMVYAGKVKAGCRKADAMTALSLANIPSSGMCSKEVVSRDTLGKASEPEMTYCEHYSTCPAIAQRQQIPHVQIVFLVRSFLTLSIPEELQNARGLIIDEKFFDLLVHVKTMPIKALEIGRREPQLSKKEREAGLSPLDLLRHRSMAATIAAKALLDGKDLGRTFHHWSETRMTPKGKVTVNGLDLVKDAKRVCSSAMTAQADIDPGMTDAEIIELCARPTGEHVGTEYRFWKTIEERILERVNFELAGRDVPEDLRIALLDPATENPDIRVAWKTEANWSSTPTLLLDASSDAVLTELVLGKREIVSHVIEVNLNMHLLAVIDRRLSMRTLFPGKDAPVEAWIKAAEALAQVRTIISVICGAHAHGRVVCGLPMKLRRALLRGWRAPVNADFMHFGAVAGIDAYRRHAAAISISRLELPTREVDGMVAAITYGTAKVEEPIDRFGTGCDADGTKTGMMLVERTLKMRDGSGESYDMQMHAGDVARRIQFQSREEEHRQFFGRPRLVYREDTVPVFAITEAIPEDMIVDEVAAFHDLSKRAGGAFWDAVRLSGGVIEPHVLAAVAPHHGDAAQFTIWIRQFVDEVPSVRARYTEIDIVRLGGDVFPAYVAGLATTPKRLLIAHLKTLGWKGEANIRRTCDCVIEPAEAAPVDKITERLGDEAGAELDALEGVFGTLWDQGEYAAGKIKPTVRGASSALVKARHELATAQMSVGAWIALPNLSDPWVLYGENPPAAVQTEGEFAEMVEAIGF